LHGHHGIPTVVRYKTKTLTYLPSSMPIPECKLGVNAVIFNTVTIFNAAKVNINQYLATNIVGAVQLIATFCKSQRSTQSKAISGYNPD